MDKRTGKGYRRSRFLFGCIFLLGGILLVACEPQATQQPPDRITIQIKWVHQSQFAGFYAADQFGYYAEEGLAVTFIEGGPTVDTTESVLGGSAQFGLAGGDEHLVNRANGKPLRAIATIFRRSPLVFVADAGLGITKPQDFVGRKILVSLNGIPTLRAMMAHVGIPQDQYAIETGPFDPALFASGEFPIWNVYTTGSINILEREGFDFNIIYPDDYGVHFYNDTIFATDSFLGENPELVARFLRATLRGWQWAIENPEEAGALAVRYDTELDHEVQVAQMKASVPLVHTGEDQIGWMRAEIWEDMYDILMEQGLLEASYNREDAYTMEFLVEIYGEEP